MLLKSLRPLLPYVKRYRWGYAAGTLCVLLTNGIWILFPLVLGKAADDLHEGVTRHKLLLYAGFLLAIAVSKGIFQFLTRWIVIGISRDMEFDLRNDLFARLEILSCSYYQRHRTGDIMARATNDLNAVRALLGPAIMYSANTIVYTCLLYTSSPAHPSRPRGLRCEHGNVAPALQTPHPLQPRPLTRPAAPESAARAVLRLPDGPGSESCRSRCV